MVPRRHCLLTLKIRAGGNRSSPRPRACRAKPTCPAQSRLHERPAPAPPSHRKSMGQDRNLPRTVRDRAIAAEINAPHVYGKWEKTAVFARRRVRKSQYLHGAPWKICVIRKGIGRLHRPAVPASACTGPPNRPNGITLARQQHTGRELRAWRGGPGRGLVRAHQPPGAARVPGPRRAAGHVGRRPGSRLGQGIVVLCICQEEMGGVFALTYAAGPDPIIEMGRGIGREWVGGG